MAALTSLMTRFCVGEDSWLARSRTSDPSTSEVRDGNGKPRGSKERHRFKDNSPKSTAVNAGFKSSRQNQKRPPPKIIGTIYLTSTKSWTKYVKSTVLPGGLQTTPTEIVGSSSNPANSTPNTRGSAYQARTTTTPQAEHRRTKEVPARSQNSKFTSCDKRKK